jgi:putative ABC transport system permease protein
VAAILAVLAPVPAGAEDPVPAVLVSRQLLESDRLKVGEVVSLAKDAAGTGAQRFRIAGVYEPSADPARLGAPRLEVRLHLPDLLLLAGDEADAGADDSLSAVNIRLADPGDAEAFARDLGARLPGVVARPLSRTDGADAFVVLERFHLAIALVTVLASTIFLVALMVMLVDERRGTVAVLRLIGLRRRRIVLQVFLEGLCIALAGAAFGVLLAYACEGGFNRFFQWRYDTALVFIRVTPGIALRSVLLAVPFGVAASLVSSWGLLKGEVLSLARR